MNPNLTRRLDYGLLVLTILAAIPYDVGPLSMAIPPPIKPYVIFAGLVAKLILGEIKTQQTPTKPDETNPPVTPPRINP